MSNELKEMAPVAVIARVVPAATAVSGANNLVNSLAAKLASKTQKPEASEPHTDEECYEDETGNVKMCKKCEKESRNFTGNYNKYNMQERVNLVKFLKQLNEKNYAEAHKYLKKVMESKLVNRIAKNKNVRLF
jgi:hypothetical protein